MNKEEKKYIGNTQQLYSARVVRFQEGRSDRMKAIIAIYCYGG